MATKNEVRGKITLHLLSPEKRCVRSQNFCDGNNKGNNIRWYEKLYFIAFLSFSGECKRFATKCKFSLGHANVLHENANVLQTN